MQTWAEAFYKSKQWQRCRNSYLKSVGGLCEECLGKGIYKGAEEVHHKVFLTPENIKDPSVSLNFANLIALCRECHQAKHRRNKARYRVDEFGRVDIL